MINQKIQTILLEKATQENIGHLYHLCGHSADQNNALVSWIEEFTQKYLSFHNQKTSLANHPDVLIIAPGDGAKYYSAETLQEVNQACHHKADILPRKIIIIHEANKISEIQANKLLKIFEEPPVPVTIFLLNPSGKNLLTTIDSRSIKIILASEKVEDKIDLIPLKQMEFTDFYEYVQGENISIDSLLRALLKEFLAKNKFENYCQLQEVFKNIAQDQIYNNPKQYSFLKIHHALQQIN